MIKEVSEKSKGVIDGVKNGFIFFLDKTAIIKALEEFKEVGEHNILSYAVVNKEVETLKKELELTKEQLTISQNKTRELEKTNKALKEENDKYINHYPNLISIKDSDIRNLTKQNEQLLNAFNIEISLSRGYEKFIKDVLNQANGLNLRE